MARPRLTSRITPRNARRAIGVAKIVVPVLAPFVIQAAGYARHRWDLARARRLGLAPDQLAGVTGRGAALHARLARLATVLREVEQRYPRDTADNARVEARLSDLAAAMHAAELMPAARRKAAHRAVSAELDALEDALLHRLGLTGPTT
ncbi:MAG TPA: DUF6474 family protein [Pseudonocardiaceae bacterium]